MKEFDAGIRKLDEDKMDKHTAEIELNLKANIADVEQKTNISDFENVTQELQVLINDLVNKLLVLVSNTKTTILCSLKSNQHVRTILNCELNFLTFNLVRREHGNELTQI